MAILSGNDRAQAVAATAPWIITSASVVSTVLTGFGLLTRAELGNAAKGAIGISAMLLGLSLALASLSTIRDPQSRMIETAVVLFAVALLLAGSIPLAWAFG